MLDVHTLIEEDADIPTVPSFAAPAGIVTNICNIFFFSSRVLSLFYFVLFLFYFIFLCDVMHNYLVSTRK